MARSPASDHQRELVYKWENGFQGASEAVKLPVYDLRYIIKRSCTLYKIPAPTVRFMHVPGRVEWAARANGDAIQFNSTSILSRNRQTAIHEVAHHIAFNYEHFHNHHGPVWMGVYLWLLDRWQVIPLDASMPSAKALGIKFRDPIKECAPGKLKRYLSE